MERAVLVLLERLTPSERAAYVLREAFDYSYRDVGKVLALSEANARQLVRRARKDLSSERRNPVSAGEQQRLMDAFLAAARTGDLAPLEEVLAADTATHAGVGASRTSWARLHTGNVQTRCVRSRLRIVSAGTLAAGNGRAGQRVAQLFAGADLELGEDLVEVVLNGARAEEQLRADLGVRVLRRAASVAIWAS